LVPDVRSPLKWFGGKGKLAARLLPLIPPHRTYVEAFGGGASLLFAKPPSPVEVYNDIDGAAVNFFRVLRDPETFARFRRGVLCTPYAREEFEDCRESWSRTEDPVERAARWFVVVRQQFPGDFGTGWALSVEKSDNAHAWLSTLKRLPEVHGRFLGVQVEHRDWREVLDACDRPETFFYLDPPYLKDTRSRSGGYGHELTRSDHAELVARVQRLKGRVLLSGYASEVYAPLDREGWNRIDWPVPCGAAGEGKARKIVAEGVELAKTTRVETVWANYPIRPKARTR
jgi:DNA adenine methylase